MVGFLLIAIGTTVKSIYHDFEMFMEEHHFKPAELLIAIGIIILFVALLGCVGAIKESTLIVNIVSIEINLDCNKYVDVGIGVCAVFIHSLT